MMSGFGQSMYGQSQSNFSIMNQSQFAAMSQAGSGIGPQGQRIKFLKTSQQNHQDQLDGQRAYYEAKKEKEREAQRKKIEK